MSSPESVSNTDLDIDTATSSGSPDMSSINDSPPVSPRPQPSQVAPFTLDDSEYDLATTFLPTNPDETSTKSFSTPQSKHIKQESYGSPARPTSAGPPILAKPIQVNPTSVSVPPPSVLDTSASPEIPPGDTTPSEGTPTIAPSALRRTASSSSADGGQRDRKRLRFTQLPHGESAGLGLDTNDDEHVYYPGKASDSEERIAGSGRNLSRESHLRSDPGTPNLSETADHIRRTLSLASLDALLSADPKERDRLLAGVSKAGRELVWRHPEEEKLYPRDAERALVLAIKRGLRSFILAFSVRSGVNVLLLLFRVLRRKKLTLAALRHALVGPDSFRFGAMLGTFTFLNTATLHLLRLAPPLSYLRRRYKTGIFNTPSFGPPAREGAEGERKWQAAVAGAVGSLGLLWETSGKRTGIAQQMFVRGLQGSYNQYTPRLGIHIPHGDVILFGLCCGQIMFSWLFNPETMPVEYNRWIAGAACVPQAALLANRSIIRDNVLPVDLVQRSLEHKVDTMSVQKPSEHLLTIRQALTPDNGVRLRYLLEKVKSGWKPDGRLPCEMLHPWQDSCVTTNLERFWLSARFMLPVYSALHLVPMLVLRRKHFQRDPITMLAKVVLGITRSCSFLGVFVLVYQSLFCLRTQSLNSDRVTGLLRAILKRKEMFWLMGFASCLGLFVEEKKRRAELAMYVLPRALESAWSTARKRAYVPIVPFGETILGAVAMGMVMDAYKHSPGSLSGIVRKLLFQLVGPV